MIFFLISILAGVLTILAPCILPLLPIIIGTTSTEEKKTISGRSIRIILSLAISVIIFTLLLKASTLLIDIPNAVWNWFTGLVVISLGIIMLFPQLWAKIRLIKNLKNSADKSLAKGYQKKTHNGDYLVGVSLGPVFSTCSPTYLFIIATVLPASFSVGLIYLFGFTIGLVLSLLLVAYFGQSIINKVLSNSKKAEIIKKIFGIIILVVGVSIVTGLDKKFEAWILDSGYGATINFEQNLIDNFGTDPTDRINKINFNGEKDQNNEIPRQLKSAFPYTNWSRTDESIEKTLSGGPGKDGIPAIDSPQFIKLNQFSGKDNIQAIVLSNGNEVKVYPYNILNWHEIVNDTIGDKNVAVTFCPLCGSALVFDRKLSGGITTFGVSGFLIESNMVMYDRDTESLWQQSTGKAIAGDYLGVELENVSFQLLEIGQVKKLYPDALILSDKTGHNRDYDRNPYSGYSESESFIFNPSVNDKTFSSKRIMVAFKLENTPVTLPMDQIKEGEIYYKNVESKDINITRKNGEIFINDSVGNVIPFYFEMWFSWAVQNRDIGKVITLD